MHKSIELNDSMAPTDSKRGPGPNSLWRIDGHHSLIRWMFLLYIGALIVILVLSHTFTVQPITYHKLCLTHFGRQ